MRRVLAVLAVLGLVTTACGGGEDTDAGAVPGTPSQSETTVGPEAPHTTEVAVWLARGETLESVNRTVPRVPGIGAEAVKALLAGPTTAESRSGFSTAVPRDTRFIGLVIDGDGIAKVDLTRDFESGGAASASPSGWPR